MMGEFSSGLQQTMIVNLSYFKSDDTNISGLIVQKAIFIVIKIAI